jgi:hypothetical protein
MERKINWFGLAAGITTLVLLIVSAFMPWWELIVGNNFVNVYASPIVTNFGLYGAQFNLPLIWAWNLSNILLFTAGGIIMLIYSIFPTKSYSQDLLSFSYKKPLYALLSFVVGLVIIVVAAGFFDVTIPLMGSDSVTFSMPSFIPISASISSSVTATFMLPFYLAIAAAVLCVAARIYHGRLNNSSKSTKPIPIETSSAFTI